MPHFPKPFFRSDRAVWFVQVGGKQVRLSPDRDEAFRLYHELVARPPGGGAGRAGSRRVRGRGNRVRAPAPRAGHLQVVQGPPAALP